MHIESYAARVQLEHAIEEAIAHLDLLDGDTDLEPSLGGSYNTHHACDAEGDGADDEPSLGATTALNQERWSQGSVSGEDREHDTCDDEDNGDYEPWLAGYPNGRYGLDAEKDDSENEPSLGSFDRMINQEKSYRHTAGTWSGEDLELDRCDAEPSLGSVQCGDQRHWAQGRDAEENGDEQDLDGDELDGEPMVEDKPVFPSGRAGSLHLVQVEAAEMARTAAWLRDRVANLRNAERLAVTL